MQGRIRTTLNEVQEPQTQQAVTKLLSERANTLESTMEYLALMESFLNDQYSTYGRLVLNRLKQVRDIEDNEKRAYALENITTLVPMRSVHKFNFREELSRMEEALQNGYREEENEKPVSIEKLLKIFQTRKVMGNEVNLKKSQVGEVPQPGQ